MRSESDDTKAQSRARQWTPSRFHWLFGPSEEAACRLKPGERLRVSCPDCDNRWADGTLLEENPSRTERGSSVLRANPMAGPIEIDGARAKLDAIAVHIEEVDVDSATGRTLLAPAHGLLSTEHVAGESIVPRQMYEWRIDRHNRRATLANPIGPPVEISIPVAPFVGCIGVCPEWGQSIATVYAGDHGGNMDLPSLRAGTTIYLPVFADSAGLMLGDIHAAQGHGEIVGGGVEVAGSVTLRASVIAGWSLDSPRLRTPDSIGAVASDGDLRRAVERAYARLLDWIAGPRLGMNRFDAYVLISQVGRIEIGNLVNAPFTVAALCPLDALPSDLCRSLEKTE